METRAMKLERKRGKRGYFGRFFLDRSRIEGLSSLGWLALVFRVLETAADE